MVNGSKWYNAEICFRKIYDSWNVTRCNAWNILQVEHDGIVAVIVEGLAVGIFGSSSYETGNKSLKNCNEVYNTFLYNREKWSQLNM